MFAIEHYLLAEKQQGDEEKHFLRERLEKITDSPVQLNTDGSRAGPNYRNNEEGLRIDYIRHHQPLATTSFRLRGQRPKKSAANHRRYRGEVLTLTLDPEVQLEARSAEHIDIVRRG